MATRDVRLPLDLIKLAAEYRWSDPSATWEEIASKVGRTRKTVGEWRKTEAWEIAFRNAGAEIVESMAPAAVQALLKAWAKGNPANAIDVLRSFGFVRNEHVEIKVEVPDADEQATLEKLLERARE